MKTVSLFCDGCFWQNIDITKKNLPVHTYMPVDAAHAIIERFVRKRIIWVPSEWPHLYVIRERIWNPSTFWKWTIMISCYGNHLQKVCYPVQLTNHRWSSISDKPAEISIFQKGENSVKIKYFYADKPDEYIWLVSWGNTKGLY